MNPISVWVQSNILKVKLIALGTIIMALVGFHYYDRYTYSQQHVKAAVEALNQSYQKAIDTRVLQSQKETEDMRLHALQLEKDKDAKIKSGDIKLAAALSELRNRPSRSSPSSITAITGTNEACTGSQLFREDAEFLTGEAYRADQVIIWRDYYYEQYEAARKALDEAAK